jgi:hypothetical protein
LLLLANAIRPKPDGLRPNSASQARLATTIEIKANKATLLVALSDRARLQDL